MYDQDGYEGQPTKILKGRQGMKKLFSALLAGALLLAMGLSLTACGPQASGMFYSLEEAYEAGFLTRSDLISIAYFHNGGRKQNESVMEEGYAPKPKDPQELSEEISFRIRSTAASDYRKNRTDARKAMADDFTIIEYCGTYNDCVAIMLTDIYTGYTGAFRTEMIDGLSFCYNSGNTLQIWRDLK